MRYRLFMFAAFLGVWTAATRGSADVPALQVAFGECDITPALHLDNPVWLAGYGPGRQATGVHDPLFARCCVIQSGTQKLAFISVDLIGLQFPAAQRIRARMGDFTFVMISSTHNHEGPDVIGVWGKSFLHYGVDKDYVDLLIERISRLVRETEQQTHPAVAAYGTAVDESLLHDGRKPYVKDGVLRALRFMDPTGGRTIGILVQWNCHPEALGAENTLITADFPATTVARLREKWGCPVAYFTGVIGGLMAPPSRQWTGRNGQPLATGEFEFAERYGEAVADLASRALEKAVEIDLAPFQVSSKTILLPVENQWYRAARAIGVLQRPARTWTGDPEIIGPPVTIQSAGGTTGIETEVAYLRLGELHVACIPGEIYPELVYGKIPDPPEEGVDFPDALCEPSVTDILPGDKWLLFGMANDEVGYIMPKRQWDLMAPFAYQRETGQYGEINSCGPQSGPIIMRAFAHRVQEAGNTTPVATGP
ncbi:MAG: hypothetical protein ACC628_04175 [Pirellulaceae bacterium]